MEDHTHEHAHSHTRFTQVRGPREEVKPLLLLLDLIYVVTNRVTEGLLELYPGYWKIRQMFFLSVDRPPSVPRAGGPGAPYIAVPRVTV